MCVKKAFQLDGCYLLIGYFLWQMIFCYMLLFWSIYWCLFIYLFLAALGPRCCARAFSSCGERGLLFLDMHRLLIVVASLVAEHGL